MTEHPQGAKLTFWMKEKAEVVRGENLTTRRMARKEGRPATAAVTWARRGTGVEGFTTAEESAMCFLGILPTTPPPPPSQQQLLLSHVFNCYFNQLSKPSLQSLFFSGPLS